MQKHSRRQAAFLLIAGIAFALLGQAYFIWRPEFVWDGVIFYVVGALLWAAAARRTERGARLSFWGRLQWPCSLVGVRLALVGAGGGLSLAAGLLAVRAAPGADFTFPLVAWALGGLLYLAALMPLPQRECWGRLAGWVRTRRLEIGGMAALLLAALLDRAVALETIPANFGGDEGTQALAALRLLGPPLGNPFSTGWYSVPTMSFLAYGLGMRLFGSTVAGARALSAVIGTATVLATYLLAREVAGRWVGWIAAVLIAFGHYSIHFSRLASNQVADGLFLPLALWFLLRGLREGERDAVGPVYPFWFGLAGFTLGLAWYGYFGARLSSIVAGLYLGWRALVEPRFLRRQGWGILLLLMGVGVALFPLLFHYIAHPSEFFSRYNQVGILASGWLEQAKAVTGRSATALLLQQFWKSVSAFHFTPDPTFWYCPGVPLLDPVSGVFLVLGLVAVTRRARRPGYGLLLLWFWSLILLGWTLTENPPSSQRGVGIAPVAAVLAAVGLVETAGLVRRLGDTSATRRTCRWAVGVVLAIVVVINLGFYFGVYTPRRIYGNPTAEVADVLCDALEGREEVPPVYLDGAPVMYWDFGAIAFRLRGVEGQDFSPEEGVEGLDLSRGALFVVLEENRDDLARIRSAFPDGVLESFFSTAGGRPLFTVYEIPARREE